MPKKETFKKSIVIKKVTKVFYEKGYNLTSMQDIVDASGLNRSSIYNSFGNKLQLFMQCLRVHQTKLTSDIQKRIITSSNSINALQSIFELSKSTDKNINFINNSICEVANQEIMIGDFLKGHQEYMIQLFKDLVTKGQSAGTINNSKTSRQCALYLFASFQGLQISSILMEERKDIDTIISTTLSVLQ